jgi:hypothetical protein
MLHNVGQFVRGQPRPLRVARGKLVTAEHDMPANRIRQGGELLRRFGRMIIGMDANAGEVESQPLPEVLPYVRTERLARARVNCTAL